MKTAIVYYSMSGNTKQTAETIAKEIGADLIRIDPVKEYPDKGAHKFLWGGMKAVMGDKPKLQPYVFDGSYERIIIGTPVWASSFSPPIRSFVAENQSKLSGKSVAAFVCYAGGGADKALLKLRRFLGIDGFTAELILTDPKDHPTKENEEKLQAFCQKLEC